MGAMSVSGPENNRFFEVSEVTLLGETVTLE